MPVRRQRLRDRVCATCVCLLACLDIGLAESNEARYVARNDSVPIQDLVDDLRRRLQIAHPVTVEIVQMNALLVSVEPLKDLAGSFRLSMEDAFLDVLSRDELEAAIAHELGHVWIFTHHPYLHTEELANRIAMRVVARETLVRTYEKVWERIGAAGDVARFPGGGFHPPPPEQRLHRRR